MVPDTFSLSSRCFLLLLITFPIVLTGCLHENPLDASTEADQYAREFLEVFRRGDFVAANEFIDPRLRVNLSDPSSQSTLRTLLDQFNKGKLVSIDLVGVKVNIHDEKKVSELTYQIRTSDSWYIYLAMVEDISGRQKLLGVNIEPMTQSLEETNAFTFSAKPVPYSMFLVLATVIPIFVLSALLLCARTELEWKWAWIGVILCGLGEIHLNWSTGEVGSDGTIVQILGWKSVFKEGTHGPWIVTASLPAGAATFLIKWLRRHAFGESDLKELLLVAVTAGAFYLLPWVIGITDGFFPIMVLVIGVAIANEMIYRCTQCGKGWSFRPGHCSGCGMEFQKLIRRI